MQVNVEGKHQQYIKFNHQNKHRRALSTGNIKGYNMTWPEILYRLM